MYKNALKEDLIRVVEELDGSVESTDTIVKLKTKIESSSTFESDPDFVKTLIQNCIDERVSRNEREVTSGKQKIELAKLQLAQLEKEVELQRVKNKALSLNPAAKVEDKQFKTLNKKTATHIGIREAEDWFRPIDLAKECDIYISSRSGSHKEIPITYGYTQDPFKNKSQNFKTKIKENYPQYHERENKNCFICGDSSHCARDCEKRFKPKESNDHIHNKINVNTLKRESEKQNSDECANLQYVNIFVENQPVTALIDSGCQIPVLNSSLIRVQTPSEEIITLSSCFGEQRMVEVKPINISLNQHSPSLSVGTAISPTLTEEFIIHPSVYSEIEKLGHAKSDVLLNESESSLGAHAYAYSSAISFPNVSVSNVIENSSYDLSHVKNFNTRSDLNSLIKDYKCNKIKSTKLKLSIVREKCSDIVLCKKANGAMKTSSVEFISRSPNPLPMKSEHRRFVLLRKIFQPWQWKRRKKRNRFEQTSRTLERKISMRSTKDQLVKKDVLMPILLWSPWKYRCGQRTVRLAVVACSQKQRSLRAQAHLSKSRTETVKTETLEKKLGERKKKNARGARAGLKAALSKAFPAIQNKKELETRFYASQQRQNQEPTDFVHDLLKLQKKLELGMSEKALVDHIFVRLEPQVQDYVEVRNPQTAIQLLEVLAKFEERYSCKATLVVHKPNNGRNVNRDSHQNNRQGNQGFESRNRFRNDDRKFNDRGYQFRNQSQNNDFSREDQKNRGSSENFSRGSRKQMGRLNVLKVSDIKDETFTKALWDSGAEKSFISKETYQKYFFHKQVKKSSTQVITAQGAKCRNMGIVELNIRIRDFEKPWLFHVLPDLEYPCILGIDFIGGSKIILDFDRKSLVIPDSQINKVIKTVEIEKVEIDLSKTKLEEKQKRELQDLFSSFQGLFSDKPGLTHVLYHEIDTGDNPPVVSRPYRYDSLKQEILDYQVDKMLKEVTIIPIQSPYASPVVLCRKNNGLKKNTG
ncbi:uncharacterized protein TNCV_3039591 [Trichonephila clavipes]|uniref:CCHC-type domain-containing protein n=1 Tax=Trichonephila clavipes TaxID=2585209 RepID=A0A8X6RVD0_TRICX|nr:uncharacterized protein TNCV_3039591 [Trichonephila clavipes]